MSLPTVNTPNTTAFTAPAQMKAITWALNSSSNTYDIFNSFTPTGNPGNLEVIEDKILITLSVFQGEWASQPSFGIPFDAINQNSYNPDILANILSNEILTVQNVNSVRVNDLDYQATTRSFNASFTVNTTFGTVTVTTGI